MTDDPVVIRAYQPGDEHAFIECFNAIFDTDQVGVRTLAHWRWQFLQHPLGQIQIIHATHPEVGMLGAYSGIPIQICAEGRRQQAAQAVDLMVRREWRRHGGGPGLFVKLGLKWIETYMGTEEGENLFTYGYPVPAWRSGRDHLDWIFIRDWQFHFRELHANRPRSAPDDLDVREVERYSADVDALFAQLEPTFDLATVRDSAYLNWRYADHPSAGYELYECREGSSGALRGICVYGIGDVPHPQTAYIVDWLCPLDDQDANIAMLAALEARAQAGGYGVLSFCFPQAGPHFLEFQRLGYMVSHTPYFIALRTTKWDGDFYRGNWYSTMGDSDLI